MDQLREQIDSLCTSPSFPAFAFVRHGALYTVTRTPYDAAVESVGTSPPSPAPAPPPLLECGHPPPPPLFPCDARFEARVRRINASLSGRRKTNARRPFCPHCSTKDGCNHTRVVLLGGGSIGKYRYGCGVCYSVWQEKRPS